MRSGIAGWKKGPGIWDLGLGARDQECSGILPIP
jgi:hypothetical protein